MALEEKVLYLRLSPEFGGVRFGHFEQRVVRLGSDPSCDISIAQGFGVAPEHAQVICDGPTNIIIAPADRAADVYLWKPHAPRPELVSTPTAIRPGESFALATPNGPRFIVELDDLPPELQEQRSMLGGGPRIGGRKLTAKSMGDEVKRQAFTTLLVTKPAQLAQRVLVFVKSGAILQPRNIIIGITMLSGYAIRGASLCSARKSSASLVTAQARLDGCEAEKNAAIGAAGDPIQMTFSDLAGNVTGSFIIGSALKKDKAFNKEVRKRTKSLLADSAAYDWLYRTKSSRANTFINFRETLDENDRLDNEITRLLVWMVAPPDAKPLDSVHYRRSIDSENDNACARGPMGMTLRQATSLGLDAQIDAFHRGSASSIEDNSVRKEKIETVAASLELELPEDFTISIVAADSSNSAYCVYAEGDDDRDRVGTIMPALNKHFDKADDDTVPLASTGKGYIARIARWYAADLYSTRFDPSRQVMGGDLDFKSATRITPVFDNEGDRGDWVIQQAAEIFARSIAVPCIGVLDTDKEADRVAMALGENVPQAIYCLVLNYQLTSSD
jgi:hypothetical protein